MFSCENLTFSYDRKNKVFDEFSYEAQSERIGIIGQNGSGKTTLLKLLCGILTPTSGKLIVSESIYMSVFNFNYYKKLTIQDLLDLAETLETFDTDKAPEVIRGLRLSKYLNQRLKNLSQGTYKKVGLLMTFLSDAELLLVDEPFKSVDRESCDFIKRYLLESKRPFIIVDHRVDEVEEIVDEVLDLNALLELEEKAADDSLEDTNEEQEGAEDAV